MAETTQLNQIQKPTSFLHVYHRKHRPKHHHPNLPEELILEILKHLPVSSLLQFMCVSKSWYSLITNPSFVSSHLSHQQCNSTLYSVPNKFFMHNINEPLNNWVELETPGRRTSVIVGSVHGVICLIDYFSRPSYLILWNPTIRKAFSLPLPKSPFRLWCFAAVEGDYNFPKSSLGFGFDCVSKDYKVVRVFCKWEKHKCSTFLHADVCGISKDDGWRTVHSSVEGGEFDIEHRGVFVRGLLHWMCKKRVEHNNDNNEAVKTVLTFDLAKEEFGQILLPRPLSSAVLFSVILGGEDKLAVSCKGDGSNVWVMEEYGVTKSWRKMLNFYVGESVGTIIGAAVGVNGKVVVTTSAGNWICWDPSNEKLKNLALPVPEPYYVDTFVQSLVLLGFKNRALGCKKLPLKKKVEKRLTAIEYRQLFYRRLF